MLPPANGISNEYRTPSCTRNGPVLDEIYTWYPLAPAEYSGWFKVVTTPVSRLRYLQHPRMFAARTSDRLDAVTAALAWCGASIEAVVYPKRSSTRRDIYVASACARSTVVSPRRIPQHQASRGIMRMFIPFKTLPYIISQRVNYGCEERASKLWRTCSAVSVYVVVRNLKTLSK